jgi:hypothetical protein
MPAFFSHTLATNFLMLCWVTDEATDLKTEDVIMQCLIRAIHISERGDNSVWSNNGMIIKRGKLEGNRRNTGSTTTSPITDLTSSRQEVNLRLCDEVAAPGSPNYAQKSS